MTYEPVAASQTPYTITVHPGVPVTPQSAPRPVYAAVCTICGGPASGNCFHKAGQALMQLKVAGYR